MTILEIKGVIFDLDGVIVSTDNCHYEAWKLLADGEGIYFDREINERLRGVSRMESLDIVLEKSTKIYTIEEKNELATIKNNYYRRAIEHLTPNDILPGVIECLAMLKEKGILVAIGSSSKNAKPILNKIGLDTEFDAIVDGNDISESKPHPEVFIKAGLAIGISPENCLVVEDADAGVQAAIAANMRVLGVGAASKNPLCNYSAKNLNEFDFSESIK